MAEEEKTSAIPEKFVVFVNLGSRKVQMEAEKTWTFRKFKEILYEREIGQLPFNALERQQRITAFGLVGANVPRCHHQYDKTLEELGFGSYSFLHLSYKLAGGIAKMEHDEQRQVVTIFGPKNIDIASFHVSCRSDKLKADENVTGVVLYSYEGNTDWYLNGVHCKSGYVILKLSKNIQHIKNEPGQVHGACYKSVFGRSLDKSKVVGGGFGYVGGKWKFNSWTFNSGDSYHDGKNAMHDMEIKCIKAAIENWRKGIQNTYVKDICPFC